MSEPEPRRAVIHIISRFKVKKPNQAFRCVLIYQDLTTKYCIVRPLLFKLHLEIMMELFKIFTSYGPPHELIINSCAQEVVDNVEAHLQAICPMFHVRLVRRHGDNNDVAMKVVTALHKWIGKTQKDEWEVGCSIVQRKINSQPISPSNLRSPHELFFAGKYSINNNDVSNNNGVPNNNGVSNNNDVPNNNDVSKNNDVTNNNDVRAKTNVPIKSSVPAVRKNVENIKVYSGNSVSNHDWDLPFSRMAVRKNMGTVKVYSGKHSPNIGKPSSIVGQTSTKVGIPAISVGKPLTDVGKTSSNVGKPSTNVGKPSENVGNNLTKVEERQSPNVVKNLDIVKVKKESNDSSVSGGEQSLVFDVDARLAAINIDPSFVEVKFERLEE